jgi:hypothetical protein
MQELAGTGIDFAQKADGGSIADGFGGLALKRARDYSRAI